MSAPPTSSRHWCASANVIRNRQKTDAFHQAEAPSMSIERDNRGCTRTAMMLVHLDNPLRLRIIPALELDFFSMQIAVSTCDATDDGARTH